MNDFPTTPVAVGRWGRKISDAMRRTNSSGLPGVSQLPGGMSQNSRTPFSRRYINVADVPFYFRKTGDTTGIVTGGNLIFPTIMAPLQIANSSSLTVANNDWVWLQRNGANSWGFANGASQPTDKLSVLLQKITLTGGKITKINPAGGWHGGDIPFPEVFPVKVVGTGDPPTYTVKDLQGVQILTGATPTNYRDSDLSYTAGTVGYAKFDGDGALTFFVEDEYASTEVIHPVIDVTWDGTTLKQTKHDRKVFKWKTDPADAITNVFTGAPCPGGG